MMLFLSTCKKKENIADIAPEYIGEWLDKQKCSGFTSQSVLTIRSNSQGTINLLNSECHSGKYIDGNVQISGSNIYIGSEKFEIIQAPTKIDTIFLNNGLYSVMEIKLKYKEIGINVGNRDYHYYKLN